MRKSNHTSIYQFVHYCLRSFLNHPIYSCFLLFIIYLQIMDMILYFKVRSRGLIDSDQILSNQTNANDIHIFDSLPVKKIMVGPTTQYFQSPLAELFEWKFHFTYYFPFISANSISYLHCLLSLISLKFFSHESHSRRQIGVFIFEFRSILDCLDGVIYRVQMKNSHYKSYYGNLGYYIDAISDILGGICLVMGCLIYFSKHRPLKTIKQSIQQTLSNDMNAEEKDFLIINVENDVNIVESKGKILISLSFFALRYALSAIFWDRNVRIYEDLLDSYTNNSQKQALQLNILHSPLTILIFYLWRYLSAISLQDYLLIAIFFDRTWEFIQKTSVIGWISLLFIIFLSELHTDQIRSIFSIFLK